MAPNKDRVPPPLPMERGVVVVTGTDGVAHRFAVEVADSDAERQRGLMYRETLSDDAGMLFIFEAQRPLSFWMKNTWIPLDMVFIDEDLVVKGVVENAEPLTLSGRAIDAPTRHVLEVNGGLTRKLGIGAGAKVTFEGVPTEIWAKKAKP